MRDINEVELWKAYHEMKKMSMTQLYALRDLATKKHKTKFLKLIDYAIKARTQDKLEHLII